MSYNKHLKYKNKYTNIKKKMFGGSASSVLDSIDNIDKIDCMKKHLIFLKNNALDLYVELISHPNNIKKISEIENPHANKEKLLFDLEIINDKNKEMYDEVFNYIIELTNDIKLMFEINYY